MLSSTSTISDTSISGLFPPRANLSSPPTTSGQDMHDIDELFSNNVVSWNTPNKFANDTPTRAEVNEVLNIGGEGRDTAYQSHTTLVTNETSDVAVTSDFYGPGKETSCTTYQSCVSDSLAFTLPPMVIPSSSDAVTKPTMPILSQDNSEPILQSVMDDLYVNCLLSIANRF